MKIAKCDNKNISGKKLRELRLKYKLTQQQLAEKMQLQGIDVSLKEISKIENNSRLVRDLEVLAFSKIFNVPVNVFYND